ncbi:MAG: cytochrome-c peroxidase [Nitrospiraceae bacterium]|nr:cytochrome-c peroxidase [Nitrospiraceae bacterium]
MNIFTKFRRSRMHLTWALGSVVAMAGVAVAQQVCPTLPSMVFQFVPTVSSLKGVPVPLPKQLDTVVKDRQAAIVLGKAFFWDKQVGSDGQACASCHFHAGADNRTKHQLNPGGRAVPEDTVFKPTRTGGGGPNYQLKKEDFPFHVLSNPLDRNSTVLFDSTDATSSQGTFSGMFTEFTGQGNEVCALETSGVFQVNGKVARKVEPRNTPTMINAIFQFRSFWDGRANNHFNGVNPFGRRDTNARVLVRQADGSIMPEVMDLENAALASQAVGPTLSDFEMSCANRSFKQVGRKLLTLIPRPLFGQKVELDDSVLGPYADPHSGLKTGATYESLIQAAFHDKYWLAPGYVSPEGYTLMEENFTLFWGLAIMMYESTLVSDQTSFDDFTGIVSVTPGAVNPLPPFFGMTDTVVPPNYSALNPSQVNGMTIFSGKAKCITCHEGPDFTGAGFKLQFTQTINQESLIQRMLMGDHTAAIYDNGFYNIGVAPTNRDLGIGADDPFGNPLSFSRQLKQSIAGKVVPDTFVVNPCMFGDRPCVPVSSSLQRDAVDGSFKTPSLRNVELTGPYFHNGAYATLEQVVEFYNRGGNHRGPINNSSGTSGFDHSPDWGSNPTNLDIDIQPLGLTAQEQADLVAFLKGLTDNRVRCEQAPFDHPSLTNFNGHAAVDANGDGKLDDLTVLVPSVGAGGRPAKGMSCLQPFLPENSAPAFMPASPGRALVGTPYSYRMRATDPNLPTDSLTYSLEGPIPAGMAISPTGMITWVPSASHEGTHHVNVRVKDRGDLYVTQSVSVTVNANLPPVIISKPSMTAKVGVPYSYTLRAWDPNGSSGLTYISRYGNPGNLTINATTGVVTWTPTADQTGNIVIRLRVTDSGKLAAEQTYYVKVAP